MPFWLDVSTNGDLCHIWNDFCFCWYKFGCGWLCLVEKCLQKRRWFFYIRIHDWSVWLKKGAITAKQHKCRLIVFKRNGQNVAARCALERFVTVSIILLPCIEKYPLLLCTKLSMTIETSNIVLNWCLCLFNKINPIVTLQEKRICLFIERNIAIWHVNVH